MIVGNRKHRTEARSSNGAGRADSTKRARCALGQGTQAFSHHTQTEPGAWARARSRCCGRLVLACVAVLTLHTATARADGESEATPSPLEGKSAAAIVHEGNRLLDSGEPAQALEAYRQAESLDPEAREIAYVQGLAHYALGDHPAAREAFEKAALDGDALADDATYGIGTTYHAEALAHVQDPQAAIASLESAMRRYRDVLSRRPKHEAAREANFKAATVHRQIKQLLEQQEQQQNQGDEQEESDEQQRQQQSDQSSDDQQQDQQSSPEDSQQQDEPQEEDQQQRQEEEQQTEQADQQQPDQAQQEEREALREQAQRRLRELMQSLRERLKHREVQPQPQRGRPVDKDW